MAKPYRTRRFGILNHVGGIWTPETFDTELAARAYINAQQLANPTWTLGRHRVVPIRVTISEIKKP